MVPRAGLRKAAFASGLLRRAHGQRGADEGRPPRCFAPCACRLARNVSGSRHEAVVHAHGGEFLPPRRQANHRQRHCRSHGQTREALMAEAQKGRACGPRRARDGWHGLAAAHAQGLRALGAAFGPPLLSFIPLIDKGTWTMFDREFFPTPAHIVQRMLAKISTSARHFLEPSAGKGDIAEGIKERFRSARIDCIEQSPELMAILADKDFSIVGHDWLSYAGVCYYDAIVMNPPFSNGDDHLLRAWDFLHHGEIVCLLNEETLKNPCTESRKRLANVIQAHGEVETLGECFSDAQRK